jgi:hypothetical protein
MMIGIGTPNIQSRIPRPMISSYVQFWLSDRLHRRCHAERHHQDCGNPFHVTLPLNSIQRVEERTNRNPGKLFLLNAAEIVDQIENTGSYVCFQIRRNTNIRNTHKVFSGINRVSRTPNRHVA